MRVANYLDEQPLCWQSLIISLYLYIFLVVFGLLKEVSISACKKSGQPKETVCNRTEGSAKRKATECKISPELVISTNNLPYLKHLFHVPCEHQISAPGRRYGKN